MIELGTIVYVISPMTIYEHEKKYWKPINKLKTQFPDVEFILPHDLFTSHNDWRENLDYYIHHADSGVILSDKGIIGYGCYEEIFRLIHHKKQVYFYNKDRLTNHFSICSIPGKDWKRYAKIKRLNTKDEKQEKYEFKK